MVRRLRLAAHINESRYAQLTGPSKCAMPCAALGNAERKKVWGEDAGLGSTDPASVGSRCDQAFGRLLPGRSAMAGRRTCRGRPRRTLRRGKDGTAQGWSLDADGDAVVLKAVQQGVDQGLVWKELGPGGEVEIGGDDGRRPPVAAVHQMEEGVGLFGFQGQVPELVNLG